MRARTMARYIVCALWVVVITATACGAQVTDVYKDPNMDFGLIQNVAVMPLQTTRLPAGS